MSDVPLLREWITSGHLQRVGVLRDAIATLRVNRRQRGALREEVTALHAVRGMRAAFYALDWTDWRRQVKAFNDALWTLDRAFLLPLARIGKASKNGPRNREKYRPPGLLAHRTPCCATPASIALRRSRIPA